MRVTIEELSQQTLAFEKQATETFGRKPDDVEIGVGYRLAVFHLATPHERIPDVSRAEPGNTIGGRRTVKCATYADGEWDIVQLDFEG